MRGAGASPDRLGAMAAFVGLLFLVPVASSARSGASVLAQRRYREGGTFRISAARFDTVDPALADQWWAESATCALLLTYPDKQPPAGFRVAPEVAAAYPRLSNHARTYTFTVRKGFRFSTGARVRAENFAYALNRVLAMQSPYAQFIGDIVGAHDALHGKTRSARGIRVRANRLIVTLTRPVGDFPARMTLPAFCPVPTDYPIDREGVQTPPPGSGPYYIASWKKNESAVIKRNPYYRGRRPHHVERFVVAVRGDPEAVTSDVEANRADWGCGVAADCHDVPSAAAIPRLVAKYGINRSRFFQRPGTIIFYLALNTQRPLFRNNPTLRRAINLALDRTALIREQGRYFGSPADQYLPPLTPGARRRGFYPLRHPNLAAARRLARGHLRSRTAVLYCPDTRLEQAQIVRDELARLGLQVEIKSFPSGFYLKVGTRGEPFDLAVQGWGGLWADPYVYVNELLDGRTIKATNNFNTSYFDSPRYNRRMARASQLSGPARYRAYGALAADLERGPAPLAVFGARNDTYFFSSRVRCAAFTAIGIDLA